MTRNPSPLHPIQGSMSSATPTAPLPMRLRSLRGLQPRSSIGRITTTSATYSMRSRSPSSESRTRTALTGTTSTTTTLASWQHRSASPSMLATSQTLPSPQDETLANWPNGSDASPTEGPYSMPRTMGPGTNPMPSNYSPPSISPMRPPPRPPPHASLTPSPAPQPPSTLSKQLLRPPLTGAYRQSSSDTVSSTRRPRLSTIASATSRLRFREWWLTNGLPLDDSREPEPRLAWDMSGLEPEALERPEGWDGDTPENDG